MRKIFPFILISLSFLLCACSSDDDVIDVPSSESAQSFLRSHQEVIEAATEAAGILSEGTRASARVAEPTVIPIVGTRSRAGSDTLMYIVNYADGQGFAIIAAPKMIEPVIGVVDQGEYDPDNDNVGFNLYMDAVGEAIGQMAIAPPTDPITPDPTLPFKEVKYVDEIEEDVRVDPKVEVWWNQAWPEGIYCSNGLSGCTATAIAQMMSCFEQPQTMTLTYPGRDKSSITLDWSNIKKHKVSPGSTPLNVSLYWCCMAGNDAHNTIGRMCRQIGQVMDSDYSNPERTSTTSTFILPALKYFFPQKTVASISASTYNWANMCNAVSKGLVMFNGGDSQNRNGGHSWVADGYVSYHKITKEYVREVGKLWELTDTIHMYKRWLHFNWGWSGDCNGYFTMGLSYIKSNNPVEPDEGATQKEECYFDTFICYSVY